MTNVNPGNPPHAFLPRLSIWQAPTGSIAGPELAASVANAGAMGALALTGAAPNDARETVRQVREATVGGVFYVNFALAFPPDALGAALEGGARVATFSWGDPLPYLPLVRSFGATVGVQVTSARGARRAINDAGADFLVCQGVEAGGHVQSATALWELLPQVVAEANGVPVIAAGGIGDGAGIARALQLGATGACLGTRFVATRESRAHDEYKAALVTAHGASDTALTVCFDGDWPYAAHRVLRNTTFGEWEASGCPASPHRPGESDTVAHSADGAPILRYGDVAPRAGFTGDIAAMCLYAGTSCAEINDLPGAGELVARLWADAQAAAAR